MRKLICLAIAAMTLGLFAGCNTMDGFGKDVEKVGGKISDSASKKKD